MCGIAGISGYNQESVLSGVKAMNHAQAHRGPDDEGIEVFEVSGGYLAFGHRRLSILDLTSAGHQPMRNFRTGDRIVFNGEIYNYPELRRQMEQKGIVFKSNCDTEVILYAFEQWGTDCFDYLHGMFALAIYDRSEQKLILARDPMGIKPLYYAAVKDGFIFASELRAIIASGMISKEIDRRAVAGLLAYGVVQEPLTMYKQIKLLTAGTIAIADMSINNTDSNFQIKRYWNFPEVHAPERPKAVEEIRRLLSDSVRSHLLSDVPVGIFLSSGLDSTAIAALCSEIAPDHINTFTVSIADMPEMDENPAALETSRIFRTHHHSLHLTEAEVCHQVNAYLKCLNQPTLDGLNTYIISGAVRAHGIKVALSGLGGDEIFGGYPSFRDVPKILRLSGFANRISPTIRSYIAKCLFTGKSKCQRQKAREMAGIHPSIQNIYFRRRRLFSDLEIHVFGFDAKELNLDENFLPSESEPDRGLCGQDIYNSVSILESRFYMGNTLLRDADVFGMAHGLEIRVPFLDRALINYAMSLPGKWRTAPNGVKKPLLADAVGDKLRSNLKKLPKRGFSLPQAFWMAGYLRERFESLLKTVKNSGLLEPAGVSAVWQDFFEDQTGPTWSRAWMLGILGAWLENRF
jgi:asparagine synthase (glutamine-hydrolysing)